jgi:hypothetical protein
MDWEKCPNCEEYITEANPIIKRAGGDYCCAMCVVNGVVEEEEIKALKPGDLLYVVLMRRWGDKERHCYLLGVYASKRRAGIDAENEAVSRSGKYDPEILEVRLDFDTNVHREVVREAVRRLGIAPAPWARSDAEPFDPEAQYAGIL